MWILWRIYWTFNIQEYVLFIEESYIKEKWNEYFGVLCAIDTLHELTWWGSFKKFESECKIFCLSWVINNNSSKQ